MKHHVCCVFLTSILIFGLSCAPVMVQKTQLTIGPGDARWIKKTLAKMTLKEKIGQMVVWSYTGKFANDDSDFINDLKILVRDRKLGGLILLGGEVYETAYLTNKLQLLAKIPLLIASDFERGAGNQITNATLFPPLMAIGAANSEELACQMGRITALEGRAMGIHQAYAPVVDVNINPENPIINTRSIGEDPELVSRLSRAFIRGCQENGLIATAKHFPGHGDTSEDSHSLLPTVAADRRRLDSIDLYTFKKAVEAGVKSIMTAHLYVPALDPTPDMPATLSPLIATDLLRKDFRFKGLIVTDAMTMGGITNTFSPQEAALKAVKAGVDMLLLPASIPAAVEGLTQAVKAGDISESRINDSVRRILGAKAELGLHKNKFVDIEALPQKIARKEYLKQAALGFESAMTLVKNEGDIIPLAPSAKKVAVFSLSSDPGDYYAGRPFVIEVSKRRPGAVAFYADLDTGQEFLSEGKAQAQGTDIIIFALFSTVRAGKGSTGLDAKHIQMIRDMTAGEAPVVVISFGSPYFLKHFAEVEAYICAYRNVPAAHDAAAKALFGEIEFRGKLPVSIPDLFPVGHGIVLPKK